MYKTKTLLLACSLLPFLASCDGEQERHELKPVITESQSLILYADETIDSLCFTTYDSWTATPQVDWISVDGNSQQDFAYDNMICYLCKVFLNVKPNTTGKTRMGTVLVQSYDYSCSFPFYQLGLLNVSHPAWTHDTWLDENARIPEVAHYELIDSAHWTSDSICFTVQNDWKLVIVDEAPEWLTLDNLSGVSGKNHVHLTLVPNTDTENERVAKLKLVTEVVSNEIVVRQLPAKKEEE